MFKKGIFFRRKGEYDSKFILSPIENFHRDKYLNLRIFLRILTLFPFGFYLGASMYYTANSLEDLFVIAGLAVGTFILAFYLLQIPYEIMQYLIFSKGFRDKDAKIKILNRKRLLTAVHNGEIKRGLFIFSLLFPMLVITSSIILVDIYMDFYSIVVNTILFANIILCTEDILNFFLSLSKKYSGKIFELPNDYKYLMEKEDALV